MLDNGSHGLYKVCVHVLIVCIISTIICIYFVCMCSLYVLFVQLYVYMVGKLVHDGKDHRAWSKMGSAKTRDADNTKQKKNLHLCEEGITVPR